MGNNTAAKKAAKKNADAAKKAEEDKLKGATPDTESDTGAGEEDITEDGDDEGDGSDTGSDAPPAEGDQPAPQPKRGRSVNTAALEDMKVRNIAWRPNNVLRVVKDFDFEDVSYKAGEVFDWQGLGLHRVKVRRLYAQRLLRHAVEDIGVQYPFRKAPEQIKKQNKGDAPRGWDSLPDHLKPKAKTPPTPTSKPPSSSEEIKRAALERNRQLHGGVSGDDLQDDGKGNYGGQNPPEGKKFNIKGDTSGK